MAEQRTLIVQVVHENGDQLTAALTGHPNATLFEVVSGPHAGKRGADSDLLDLVGPIEWERGRVSIYETDELLTWLELQARQAAH